MNPDQGLSRSNSSFRRSSASKIDQLYEISYVSDESKVPITSLSLVNPYSVFKKPQNSLSKKVKQLVGSVSNPVVKEFVQTSKFDSHQLPATTSEHLVPLSFPSHLPRICLSQGYTHIHFGAIRLALTFHGRKGLPAFSRIARSNSSFRRSSASKIDQLYEISYISDESKVPITSLPLVNLIVSSKNLKIPSPKK